MTERPELPNVDAALFDAPDVARLRPPPAAHAPRFLLLYGSLCERSFSRFAALEAGRLLTAMGGEVRIFHAHGLPLPDDAGADHPKVAERRELVRWCEGMV